MIILAIDPGNEFSGVVIWDDVQQIILFKHKLNNLELINKIKDLSQDIKIGLCAIEMISSYGLAVGQTTLDTCVWIGIFKQALENELYLPKVRLIFRKTIKMHHCQNIRIKDGELNMALRNKYGEDNTVKTPNPIYYNEIQQYNGSYPYMNGDIFAAFALALYISEPKDYPLSNLQEREENKLTKNLLYNE